MRFANLILVPLLAGSAVGAPTPKLQGHWTKVDVDARGAVTHLQTDDRELVRKAPWTDDDVFTLRGVLQLEHDALGGRADEREPVRTGDVMAFMLFDDSDVVVGAAIVHRSARRLDIEVRHAKLSATDAAKRVVGRKVTQTIVLGHGPQLDCNMGPGDCRNHVVRTSRREVTLAQDEVGAALGLHPEHGTVRLVACVWAEHEVPEPPAPNDIDRLDVLENRLSGIPVVLDAVTGDTVAIRIRDCNDPAITR